VICEKCVSVVGPSGKYKNSATIRVSGITATGKIDKVWAVLIPPDYLPGSADNPVTNLPTLRLQDSARGMGKGKYQGTCKHFDARGDYDIAVYALDTEGNLSQPRQIRVSIR
jgi:hypothetical protein